MKRTEASKPFYSAVALLILLAVSVFLYQKPYYNWDMFPYMALAVEDQDAPFDSVHARIYKEASLSMSPSDFEAISARQPELRKDSDEFHDILKYYRIKPGYNVAVNFFHTLGLNLVTATYLPSILSWFAIGCIMMIWLGRMIPPPFSQIISLVLMASPFLITTARFSSPDMLCAALCFGGIFLILESSVIAGLIIFLTGIAARPDAVILYLLLCIVLYKTKKLNLKLTVIFSFAGIGVVVLIMNNPELLREYLFTTPSYSPSWNSNEMIINYGISLRNGFASVLSSQIMLFTVLALITLYLRKRSGIELLKDQWSSLVIVSIASIILHYLFHPVMEDRFLIGSYLFVMIGFCKAMSEFFSTKTASQEGSKKTV